MPQGGLNLRYPSVPQLSRNRARRTRLAGLGPADYAAPTRPPIARVLRCLIQRVRRASPAEVNCLLRLHGCLFSPTSMLPKDGTATVRELEDEMARTQKNKATEYHIGLLKAKIAKLKREVIAPKKSGVRTGGFDVKKSGDATVVFIGLPSVGKSTLLNALTGAKSKTASSPAAPGSNP